MAALQVGMKPFQQRVVDFLLTSRNKCGRYSPGRLGSDWRSILFSLGPLIENFIGKFQFGCQIGVI